MSFPSNGIFTHFYVEESLLSAFLKITAIIETERLFNNSLLMGGGFFLKYLTFVLTLFLLLG